VRRRVLLACLISFAPLVTTGAQTVRGVVVDDSTKLPVEGVAVMLLDAAGKDVARGARSDSTGSFIIHAAHPGSYRVRAVRIGYQPLTSESVRLGVGQLVVMRLRMATLAQQLVPVRIVERRSLTAAELMSATGFDLRESKGLGLFLSGERLAAMGHDGVREIIASQLQPTVYVRADSVLGEVIRMRQGIGECAPEIYLDGRLLASAPESIIEWDSSNLLTTLDSIRFRMRVEAENQRIAASQGYALSVLANLRAIDLHGVEVYRATQGLPASLGGWFGLTKTALRPCGTVAIWTKGGVGLPITSARNKRTSSVQVIIGNVVSYDTGLPVGDVPLTLLSDGRDVIGKPVRSDARGEFTIRTNRAGPLRLRAGSVGYTESTTPSFPVGVDEMVVVKVFVSAVQAVMTPLGVTARIVPQELSVGSLAGFTYRRERALGGTFFGVGEIQRAGVSRLADLIRSLDGVRMAGAAPTDTVTFLRGDDLPRCRPMYFIDGEPVTGNVESAIAALAMDRVFGVEVYSRPADVPAVFADAAAECGAIAIWMKR
jgi:hypothetical protein